MNSFTDQSLTDAAEWFARRRRGVMTVQERAEYDRWSLDSANCAAMSEIERVWKLAGASRPGAGAGTPAPAIRLSRFARAALVAILCGASLGAGIISFGSHSQFWTGLDWTEK